MIVSELGQNEGKRKDKTMAFKKPIAVTASLLASMYLSACTTAPFSKPSTLAAPSPYQSLTEFAKDEAMCIGRASLTAADEHGINVDLRHIGVGGLMGFLAGVLIPGGHLLTGLTGMAIGSTTGAGTSLIGVHGYHREHEMNLFNNEFAKCMYIEGHVVPGLPLLGKEHEYKEH